MSEREFPNVSVEWSIMNNGFGGILPRGESYVAELGPYIEDNPSFPEHIRRILYGCGLLGEGQGLDLSKVNVTSYSYPGYPDELPYDTGIFLARKASPSEGLIYGLPGCPGDNLLDRFYAGIVVAKGGFIFFKSCTGNGVSQDNNAFTSSRKAFCDLADILLNNFSPRKS